jgi:type IV pilus assembly protein PilX
MKNKLYAFKKDCVTKSQKGVVLFFALIALVAMSLAAAALVRSVDSGVLVAGNLAFKQSAILSAETGISKAYKYITENSAILNTQNAGGYYAAFNDALNLTANATWSAANSIGVDKDIYDLSGNETRYIVQRMCREANVTKTEKAQKCLVGTGDAAAGSKGGKSEGGGAGGGGYDFETGGDDAIVYRVTVRVAGPKNTFSYLQAFIY